jgi:hypothetical protein
MARTASQAGISKFEFAVVVTVVAILATILLARLIKNESVAERLYLDVSVHSLQKALKVRQGNLMNTHRQIDYAALSRENPVDGLEKKLAGSAGSVENVDPESVEDGAWIYDPAQRELLYRPRFPGEFADLIDDYGVVRVQVLSRHAEGETAPVGVDLQYKPVAD